MKRFFKAPNLLAILASGFVVLPCIALAQDTPVFVPLVGVPGVPQDAQDSVDYIDALFTLAIGIAAALAVIKIIGGGVKYMFSEVVTDKGEAKKDIQGAVLGLLIILGSVVILNEVNPELTNFDFLRRADTVAVSTEHGGRCAAGEVFMQCWEGDGGQGEYTGEGCYDPEDTSWCGGEIVTGEPEDDENFDGSNEGTWVTIAREGDGYTPAMRAAELQSVCDNEGGDPELEPLNDGTIRVTCHKQ